ncbi:unnamed protein product [Somion occarium]|uniref:Uncharacterized protein n=1 Tax=Somion occarium TaxID=3059160 RepID=A0ABP1CF97_9APHY
MTMMHTTNGEATSPLHDNHDPTTDQRGRNIVNFQALMDQLEEEEALASPLSGSFSAGLPPPPRANNRLPKLPSTTPKQPLPAISANAFREMSAGPSSWNPFITSSFLHHRTSYSDPDILSYSQPATVPSSPAPSLSHSSDSSHTTNDKSVASLPPSPEVLPPPSTAPAAGFKKHHRYFASFSKVEKILGRGRLNPLKRSDSTPATPASSTYRPSNNISHKYPEMQQVDSPTQLVSTSSSDPSSESRRDETRVRSVGASAVATATGRSVTERPSGASRPLSHRQQQIDSAGIQSAAMSTRRRSSEYASTRATSESSHEPPSTPSEGRISISSTIYPGSSSYTHSINDNHYYHSSSTHFQGRSSMSGDRDSFIDMASPTSPRSPEYDPLHDSMNDPYFTSFASNYSAPHNMQTHDVTKVKSHTSPLPASKPPIPTSPKPSFRRSQSVQPSSHRPAPLEIPPNAARTRKDLPPTTNILKPKERAELVRKTQKLTQVFGQTPGPMAFSQNSYEANSSGSFLSPTGAFGSHVMAKKKHLHQRGAVSVSGESVASTGIGLSKQANWPPQEGTLYLSFGSRRHSSPLSPREFSFTEEVEHAYTGDVRDSTDRIHVGSEEGVANSDRDSEHAGRVSADVGRRAARSGIGSPPRTGSPTSFMDLSDEEVVHDGASSIITVETPKANRTYTAFSPSTPSLLSPEEQLEEDRRRKREKLAKLHRFLGSRVPQDLVLAQIDTAVPRPPVASVSAINPPATKPDMDTRKTKMRRRRSSSAAEFPAIWSDDIDRLREDLNDREKAINVRRAVKMQQMFGVAPPQTLYHTRPHTASPTAANVPSPPAAPASSSRQVTPPQSPITSALRNLNNSSYNKSKAKKSRRPGTADSATPLISTPAFEDTPIAHALSDVYLHYRHSLNSLNDIIDRDDKESLVDLHDYLHGSTSSQPLQTFSRQDGPNPVTSPSIKAERRRSLPSRTSMTSISSEFSLMSITPTPSPEISDFQARRRRAAKLTQFFGVDYRELMSEILESIEKGLEEESGRGNLEPDEVQDLLMKLRKLKVKRNTFI